MPPCRRILLLVAGVFFLMCGAQMAWSQDLAWASSPERVHVSYEPPSDAKFQPIYESLKSRQVLERLQGLLAPLRLPKPLTIRVAQCDAETQHYQPGSPVTICYELIQRIADITRLNTSDADEQALIIHGTLVEAVLHEVAYAVFDLLEVPVWGREEDAADRLSALIMVQFGDEIARTTIAGTVKFFDYSNHEWTGADFAQEESPEAQRFYNYLCIAYGGDPQTFDFVAPRPGPTKMPRLSPHRAGWCKYEYAQVRDAFNLRIMPFVDPDALLKVRATKWLLPDEIPGMAK
jgi:hypothetical protein